MEILKQEFSNLTEKVGKFEMVTVPAYIYIPHFCNMNFFETKEILDSLPDWMDKLNFSYKTYRLDVLYQLQSPLLLKVVGFAAFAIQKMKKIYFRY